MDTLPTKRDHSFSSSLYRLLLFCYPAEFRRIYAREMATTFRDCYREAMQQHGKFILWTIYLKKTYNNGANVTCEARTFGLRYHIHIT